MIKLDDELTEEYLAECHEHLAILETTLLAIEKGGAEIDEERLNRAFRAVHSIQGGAIFFELENVHDLAQQTEDVLGLIRSHKMAPTPDRVTVLLRATDRLQGLIQNPGTSNQADIAEIMGALARLERNPEASPEKRPASEGEAQPGPRHLRMLLVEDDFASRLMMQTFLSRYGECHVAVNGREAVDAFRSALEQGERYDLICMDIMMPEMDGREAVRRMRAMEGAKGIVLTSGAKIIMTTTVDDIKEVFRCFQELCDAYLLKPIDLAKLLSQMKSYHLIP